MIDLTGVESISFAVLRVGGGEKGGADDLEEVEVEAVLVERAEGIAVVAEEVEEGAEEGLELVGEVILVEEGVGEMGVTAGEAVIVRGGGALEPNTVSDKALTRDEYLHFCQKKPYKTKKRRKKGIARDRTHGHELTSPYPKINKLKQNKTTQDILDET